MKSVNLQDPLRATRWLKLIDFENDPEFLKFKKNLCLSDSYIGFSFETNTMGLVPQGGQKSEGVILGTSFACGVGVDIGDRWFDHVPSLSSHFNASFPCSLVQLRSLLLEYYTGVGRELIILYHPNFWSFLKGYRAASKGAMKMADFYRWRTKAIDVFKIYLKNSFRAPVHYFSGRVVYDAGRRLDNNYCVVQIDDELSMYMESTIAQIFDQFETVKIYAVPVREQLSKKVSYESIKRLDIQRETFLKVCQKIKKSTVYDFSDKFTLDHYHASDNHWNTQGNLRFADLLNGSIN